jgi:hypothetical protein
MRGSESTQNRIRICSVRLCEEKVEDWFGKFWFVPVAIVGRANNKLDHVAHASDKSKWHQPSNSDPCDLTGSNRSLTSFRNHKENWTIIKNDYDIFYPVCFAVFVQIQIHHALTRSHLKSDDFF